MPVYKKCYTCNKAFPLDGFHRDRTKRDGHTHLCKECSNARDREHYRNHREEECERTRKYRKLHPEVKKRCDANYYQKLSKQFQCGHMSTLQELVHIEAFKEAALRAEIVEI